MKSGKLGCQYHHFIIFEYYVLYKIWDSFCKDGASEGLAGLASSRHGGWLFNPYVSFL